MNPGLPTANASDIARHRARTRTREEEHAALCVLDDWELTMTHALNSRRVCCSFALYLTVGGGGVVYLGTMKGGEKKKTSCTFDMI